MNEILRFILNREWAAFVTFAGIGVTALAENIDVLPDGTAKGWVVAGLAVVSGLIARARVWSKASVDRLA